VRVAEAGGAHPQLPCQFVHQSDEIFSALSKQSSAPAGQGDCRVVAAGQHECVEQLLDCIPVALVEFSTGATHFCGLLVDLEGDEFWVEGVPVDEVDDCVEGHDFGETGDFHDLLVVVASDDLGRGVLHHDEAFGADVAQVTLSYVEQLLSLQLLHHLLRLLPLQVCLLDDLLLQPLLGLLAEDGCAPFGGTLAVSAVNPLVASVVRLLVG